ncbi:TIGR00269 family protein [Candidatus Bathyarchaeota archaeon]|nr:TIGR00269 family protein [Candidatus Bathyarchaeota archaeon]
MSEKEFLSRQGEKIPLCTKCGTKPSIYFRPYSGERLCKGCFIDSIEFRVERTISRFDMFKFNSRIAVAVSGGKDSLNLLRILWRLEEKYSKAELIVTSVDEGIKDYRDEALKFVKESCKQYDVELQIMSFKELYGLTLDEIVEKTESKELTPCSYCGVLRRRALNAIAKRIDADVLATAHNLDDVAQTTLLNLIRGDLNRFSAAYPVSTGIQGFVRRVKPFCEIPERESAMLAYLTGIKFQSIPCPYSESAMRNDVRRFLNMMESKRPGTMFTIYKTSLNLVSAKLEKDEKTGFCEICGEPSQTKICRTCELLREINRDNSSKIFIS